MLKSPVKEKWNQRISLCFDITVYVRHSFHDCREGIIGFYEKSLKQIQKDIKWYYTETMGLPKKINPKVLEMVPSWFSPGARKREIYQMTLRSGSNEDEITPTRFQLFSSDTEPGSPPPDDPELDTGILRLTLSPDLNGNHAAMVDLMEELIKGLPFVSGHAGFGLNWEEKELDDEVLNEITALAMKYPGLDIFGFLSVENIVMKGIKCVNWLTLINKDSVKELGGISQLKKDVSDSIVLHELKEGAIIQAGPEPLLGNINKGDSLPDFKEVGRVLEPIRDVPDEDILYPFVGDEETTMEWLARFDS